MLLGRERKMEEIWGCLKQKLSKTGRISRNIFEIAIRSLVDHWNRHQNLYNNFRMEKFQSIFGRI